MYIFTKAAVCTNTGMILLMTYLNMLLSAYRSKYKFENRDTGNQQKYIHELNTLLILGSSPLAIQNGVILTRSYYINMLFYVYHGNLIKSNDAKIQVIWLEIKRYGCWTIFSASLLYWNTMLYMIWYQLFREAFQWVLWNNGIFGWKSMIRQTVELTMKRLHGWSLWF